MSRKAGEKDKFYRVRISFAKPYINGGIIRFVRELSLEEFIKEINFCVIRGYRAMHPVNISIAWPGSETFFPIMSDVSHMQFHGHMPRFDIVNDQLTAEVESCDKCRSLIHVEV